MFRLKFIAILKEYQYLATYSELLHIFVNLKM